MSQNLSLNKCSNIISLKNNTKLIPNTFIGGQTNPYIIRSQKLRK